MPTKEKGKPEADTQYGSDGAASTSLSTPVLKDALEPASSRQAANGHEVSVSTMPKHHPPSIKLSDNLVKKISGGMSREPSPSISNSHVDDNTTHTIVCRADGTRIKRSMKIEFDNFTNSPQSLAHANHRSHTDSLDDNASIQPRTSGSETTNPPSRKRRVTFLTEPATLAKSGASVRNSNTSKPNSDSDSVRLISHLHTPLAIF